MPATLKKTTAAIHTATENCSGFLISCGLTKYKVYLPRRMVNAAKIWASIYVLL